jgi:hypothetical protein
MGENLRLRYNAKAHKVPLLQVSEAFSGLGSPPCNWSEKT